VRENLPVFRAFLKHVEDFFGSYIFSKLIITKIFKRPFYFENTNSVCGNGRSFIKTYYHRQKKRSPLQPPGHRCVEFAYLRSASANHLPDSELR